jgi:hypothetical protein
MAQLSQGISYWYPHQIPQIAIDILNVPLRGGHIFVPQNLLNSLSVWSPIERGAIGERMRRDLAYQQQIGILSCEFQEKAQAKHISFFFVLN